jgi:hypothetical protein
VITMPTLVARGLKEIDTRAARVVAEPCVSMCTTRGEIHECALTARALLFARSR